MLEEQARHVAHVVREADLRQARAVEPTPDGEAGWCETIISTALNNLQFRMDCTPGYYNGEGRAGDGAGLFDGLYGPGPNAFFALAKEWREAGVLSGLDLR